MKNNKVLITLGCSFTEGVGCYDYKGVSKKQIEKYKKSKFDDGFYSKNLDNFLKGSWGSQLQEMIGASTFYNIGQGGDSNSGQSKKLYDIIDKLDLEGKDVLIVWLMTYPHRFSFYNEGIATTVAFNNDPKYKHSNKLVEGYVEMINHDYDFNVVCEQFYYLRTVAELCKNRNIRFAWANVQHELSLKILYPLLDKYLKNSLLKNKITDYSFIEDLLNVDNNKEMMSKICGHPNQKGYKEVASRFASAIFDKFPDFCKYKLEELYNNESIEYKKIPLNREENKIQNHTPEDGVTPYWLM